MKRSQSSLRKIRLLLFLMISTLIFGITATYAWFSSQREVEISGIKLNVEVAESMQISLDGEHWMQSITIDNMRQFYGTYSDTTTHQAKGDDNTNYVPTELKPVSTIGEVSSGKLQFMTGEAEMNSDGTTGVTATACSEDDLVKTATVAQRETGNTSHPYLVFDMYLRNYSSKTSDNLQLNAGSIVWVDTTTASSQEGTGKTNTGLENCIRVGFVVYENTADLTAAGSTVRGLTSSGTSAQVAIWEPNDKEHIQEVIDNSGRGVQANTTMPTYGIKYSSTVVTIDDVEATSGDNISEQVTMKPAYGTAGTSSPTNMTDTSNSEIMLEGNKITKVRVYIWIEGQDVDCVNTASQGDRLQATIKLTKPENENGTQNTYDGEGSGSSGSGSDDSDLITAASLAALSEDEAALYYGGVVTNYIPTNGVNDEGIQWKIFHSDGTNIYLIADDYVPLVDSDDDTNRYVPYGKSGTAYSTSSTYARGFALEPYANYAGWSDISSTSIATKWLSQYVASGYASEEVNMKATAYLLDTNIWSGFKDSSGYADYAIGGPTLELFTASYNKIHETDIETQVSRANGYQVRWSGGTFAKAITGLDTSESLYVISSNTNAVAMWVASPSASSAATVMGVNYLGRVINYGYSLTSYGARPCIILNSNVKLEMQEDGTTFKIVE